MRSCKLWTVALDTQEKLSGQKEPVVFKEDISLKT